MKAYMKQHGDTVAGKKIELITRDTTGPAPDVAKRFAQELITRDKVQFLAGFGLTPNAMAVAPVVDRGEGADDHHPTRRRRRSRRKSPYIDARVDDDPAGQRADGASGRSKNGIKQVYTVVADYGPGIDAETQFTKAFKAGGGEVVGTRAHAAAESRFLARRSSASRMRSRRRCSCSCRRASRASRSSRASTSAGSPQAGIKLIATGDITDDHVLAGDGRADARADHVVPLFGRARFAREQGVPQGVRRRRTTRSSRPNFMAVRRLRRRWQRHLRSR